MTTEFCSDPLLGAIDLAENITPADIWQGLHLSALAWEGVANDHGQAEQRAMIDQSDISVLSALSEYPAERWKHLCDATGWTVYGAVALSWCADADLPSVWEGWLASGFALIPSPVFERPARLLNPALMPQTRQLSALIAASTPSSLGLCAMIAASDAPLKIDMTAAQLKNAPAQIASFLKSRALADAKDNAEDRELLSVFDANIRGTDYDLWGTSEREKTRPPMAAM